MRIRLIYNNATAAEDDVGTPKASARQLPELPKDTVEEASVVVAVVEPIVEAAAAPTIESVVEFVPKPTAQLDSEPTVEPTPEPVLEAVVEPTPEVVVQSVAEPAVEPAVESAVESAIEPAVESAVEPIVEPADESIVEAPKQALPVETKTPEAINSKPSKKNRKKKAEAKGELSSFYCDSQLIHSYSRASG